VRKRRSKGEGTVFFFDVENIWVGEITLPSGKKKRKRSKNQKVVREWLLKQREAVRDNLVVADDRLTLGEFLDRYVSDVATHTLRPKTLESYTYLIRLHIKPELGNYRLVSLNPAHLQKFYSDKLNSGL
jgi:Phage integrase, N-terminal SAM-like domain